MATAQQIKDQVDGKLATLWGTLQNHQDAFFAANRRYKQLLISHSVTPADGAETLPDVGTKKPHYELSGYPTGLKNVALPFSIAVHQYVTPDGTAGYQAMVTVQVGADIWERTAQVGPETWRQHNWQKITPVSL